MQLFDIFLMVELMEPNVVENRILNQAQIKKLKNDPLDCAKDDMVVTEAQAIITIADGYKSIVQHTSPSID